MSKATLTVFCGKMAAGKSTLARQISERDAVTLMSEDSMLASLYPNEIIDVPSYVEYSGKLKAAMAPLLIELLQHGTSIVLDFPANTVIQRKWIKDIAAQAEAQIEFHYLDTPDSVCEAQLLERAIKEPKRHATDTVEMFRTITAYFEPPSSDEGFVVTTHATR